MSNEENNSKISRKKFYIVIFSFVFTTVWIGYNVEISKNDNETTSLHQFYTKEQVIDYQLYRVQM